MYVNQIASQQFQELFCHVHWLEFQAASMARTLAYQLSAQLRRAKNSLYTNSANERISSVIVSGHLQGQSHYFLTGDNFLSNSVSSTRCNLHIAFIRAK